MSNCKHASVTIALDFVMHSRMTSLMDDGCRPIMHVTSPAYGISPEGQGWWTKAYFHVRCHDCGRVEEITSGACNSWPKWIRQHWLQLVAAGGLPAEINRHYRMFEEAPCHPS